MTKNEFERLRIFLKRYSGKQVRCENAFIYFHCEEADRIKKLRPSAKRGAYPSDFSIRVKLGKQYKSLDYRTLKVDVERDVLIGRPCSYTGKAAKPICISRKHIKKVNIGAIFYDGSEASF